MAVRSIRGGVKVSSLECDKNEDGTVNCDLYSYDNDQSFVNNIEEVRTHSNVVRGSRHFGPQDEPHIEIMFNSRGSECFLVEDNVLECR